MRICKHTYVVFVLMICTLLQAQTIPVVVFNDDFNRSASNYTLGGTPIMDWVVVKNDPDVYVGTWSITGSVTGDRVFQIFNSNTEANTGTAGKSYVTGSLSAFSEPFHTTLNQNDGDVIWTFNLRSNKSSLNSFKTGNSNYASAVVLAANGSDLLIADGYAVTLMKGTLNNAVRLVRFQQGLGSNAGISTIIGPAPDATNYVSVKVVYSPPTNSWKLFVRDDGSSSQPMNPMYGEFYQVEDEVVDDTFTDVTMTHCGFFYNHGISSTNSNAKAMFDNFGVTVMATDTASHISEIKIFVSPQESQATQYALESLMRDIMKVTGRPAQLITTNDMVNVPEGAIVILNNELSSLVMPEFTLQKVSGTEAHRVYRKNNRVYLHGNDLRGTIYAIYTFSEHVLGVPPLWFWSSWVPVTAPEIVIPHNLDLNFSSPKVRYRAWFPNDQDMLTRWRKLNGDNNVSWLETMLRLKLNTVEVNSSVIYSTNGTARLSDEATLIKNYGLIISSTHTVALGTHFSNWNNYWTRIKNVAEVPELKVVNEDELKEFWEHAATTVRDSGVECIWQLSFRGDGDIPFWETFSDAPKTDAARAAVINKMWGYQYEILKRITNDPDPTLKITFYNEISDLMAAGLLTPPQTGNTIWNYVATRRDHYPNNDIINFNNPVVKIGYYMNLQFTSSGSHLTQGEGPWKMEFNHRYIDSKSPLYFAVVNAGNIREFLLSMSAHARMMWNYNTYDTNNYLSEFCRTYFGDEHAVEIATLYRDYFNAYWQQKQPDFPGGMDRQYLFQDLRYKQAVRVLCSSFSNISYRANPLPVTEFRYYNIVPADNNATNQVNAIINGMTLAMSRFAIVTAQADIIYQELPEAYKNFFNDNLRSHAHFMSEMSKVLYHLTTSYKYFWDFKGQSAQHLDLALAAAYRARDYIYSNQHDQFYDWYVGDADGGKFNIPDMIQSMEVVRQGILLTESPLSSVELYFLLKSDRQNLTITPRNMEREFTVTIHNIYGQQLMTKSGNQSQLTISHTWSPGVYLVEMLSQGKRFNKKIIIP